MRNRFTRFIVYISALGLFTSCADNFSTNKRLAERLHQISDSISVAANPFCPEARLVYLDSIIKAEYSSNNLLLAKYNKAQTLLELGREEDAIALLTATVDSIPPTMSIPLKKRLALAWMRLGERNNCMNYHSAEACIFPISGRGIHKDPSASAKAIALYKELLAYDPTDLESRWLMNIAYMTMGTYPKDVPKALLIQGLGTDTVAGIKPFKELAGNVGLDIKNMGGGAIMDDFDNDGNLDIIISSWDLREGMHFFRNNGNGSFADMSEYSGLSILTGGLNIMQTDYNNDGYKDLFVLRGAWLQGFGRQPASLLRNNADGTFTDVSGECGLNITGPSQTAVWADFNNDGWLDVFVGIESVQETSNNYCRLFLNDTKGKFTDCSVAAHCQVKGYVKGVAAGDYNNDGRMDIVISGMDGKKHLLRNEMRQDNSVRFEDVSAAAGLTEDLSTTFATWFFDYDNDGWEDLLFAGYGFEQSLAKYAAAEAAHLPFEKKGRLQLYHNDGNGHFSNRSSSTGLDKIVFAMSANFADINNDGFQDMYFGTGNPLFESLVPNKMFLNKNGERFEDITTSARVGSLQKGHGIAFGDIDNDGDLDIYIEMGGAFSGDAYQNALYINPKQNDNNWISILCEGERANKAAIGARIKLSMTENGHTRHIFKRLNSGGSFGSNSLEQQLGMATASKIDTLEIWWPGGNTQQFLNVPANSAIKISESSNEFILIKKQAFIIDDKKVISCKPG